MKLCLTLSVAQLLTFIGSTSAMIKNSRLITGRGPALKKLLGKVLATLGTHFSRFARTIANLLLQTSHTQKSMVFLFEILQKYIEVTFSKMYMNRLRTKTGDLDRICVH